MISINGSKGEGCKGCTPFLSPCMLIYNTGTFMVCSPFWGQCGLPRGCSRPDPPLLKRDFSDTKRATPFDFDSFRAGGTIHANYNTPI